MKSIGQYFTIIAAALLTLPASALAETPVRIDSGALTGVSTDDVIAYKGIPFAKPPVGERRWSAPQPIEPWSGIKTADKYGPDCMQIPFHADAAPLGVTPSEDCLYLNVWALAKASTEKRPVMVWIYGGGFVNGGSSPAGYDGSAFARSGVVLVSFNYRLGRFGFFAHPALTAEANGAPLGNYGLLDQIAALKWVQKNIAAFGGDPDNVTIFGESAGGMSVHMLRGSPLTKGLFAKAIVQSGGGRGTLGRTRTSAEAEALGAAFATAKGVAGSGADAISALRALPADAVLDGLNLMSLFQPNSFTGPFIDGQIVTASIDEAYRSGRAANVPMIIGTNDADGFFFGGGIDQAYAPTGPARAQAGAIYDPEGKNDAGRIGMAISADLMMIEPARYISRILAGKGQPVYGYRFAYVPEYLRGKLPGALHSTEIPFVFDTVAVRHGAAATAKDREAARLIHDYWVGFAKTGAPQAAGRPAWSRYDANTDTLMHFDAEGARQDGDPFRTRLDFAEHLATMAASAAAQPSN